MPRTLREPAVQVTSVCMGTRMPLRRFSQKCSSDGAEQTVELLPVNGFLQIKSGSVGKRLPHGVALFATGDDDDGGVLIPGRFADFLCKLKTVYFRHFQIKEDAIEFFLINHHRSFSRYRR